MLYLSYSEKSKGNNSKECNHNEIWKNIKKMAADKNPLITMIGIKKI
ncbi:MAG: hypothetical protein SOT46_05035 [Treponema sp.]|nr:hypothetical protein [Treponema sp.]MDY5123069.1 hypothetical protein [Treponema sp.]